MSKWVRDALIALVLEEAIRMLIPPLLRYIWMAILCGLVWELWQWAKKRVPWGDYVPQVAHGVRQMARGVGYVALLLICLGCWWLANKIAFKLTIGASIELAVTPVFDMTSGRVYADVTMKNVGKLAARKVSHIEQFRPQPGPWDEKVDRELIKQFAERTKEQKLGTNDIGIGQRGEMREEFTPIPIDQMKAVQAGDWIYYVLTHVRYTDDRTKPPKTLDTWSCVAYQKGFPYACHGGNTSPY